VGSVLYSPFSVHVSEWLCVWGGVGLVVCVCLCRGSHGLMDIKSVPV